MKEYLPTLTRRTKWHRNSKPLKIGDLVIIADGNLERNSWPKGIVTSTYAGKDDNIRVADVRTTTGTYRRPVAKLCVLDLEREVVDHPDPTTGGGMLPRTRAQDSPDISRPLPGRRRSQGETLRHGDDVAGRQERRKPEKKERAEK
jgi:hypothetical protein